MTGIPVAPEQAMGSLLTRLACRSVCCVYLVVTEVMFVLD